MSFTFAAISFLLVFGGWMALQYYFFGPVEWYWSAALVLIYFSSMVLLDMRISGWGFFKS